MERSQSRIEAASRRAEAAMRRAEAKARAAEVRARRGSANLNIGRWNWDLTPRGVEGAGDGVSDEERQSILDLLSQGKLTSEEALKRISNRS